MKSSFLIGGFIITLAFVFVLFVLIWLNRGDEKTLSLFLKMFIPISAALLLLGYELLLPIENINEAVDIQIIMDRDLNLAPLYTPLRKVDSEHWYYCVNLDRAAIQDGRAFLEKNNNLHDVRQKYVLDLLEIAVWLWLSERYTSNWQAEADDFTGVAAAGTRSKLAKNANINSRIYKSEEIKLLLEDNLLLGNGPFLNQIRVAFPAGSSVTIMRKHNRREIKITNKYLSYKILMQRQSAGVIPKYSFLSKLIHELSSDKKEWRQSHIKIRFEADFRKYLRYSPSTIKQKSWIKNMINRFRRDFEWAGISNDLEKYIQLSRLETINMNASQTKKEPE